MIEKQETTINNEKLTNLQLNCTIEKLQQQNQAESKAHKKQIDLNNELNQKLIQNESVLNDKTQLIETLTKDKK
jgi:hypothetical protein